MRQRWIGSHGEQTWCEGERMFFLQVIVDGFDKTTAGPPYLMI